jgi:hypothetical protein
VSAAATQPHIAGGPNKVVWGGRGVEGGGEGGGRYRYGRGGAAVGCCRRFSADAGIFAWFKKVKRMLKERAASTLEQGMWSLLFEKFDTDGDGSLTEAEFVRAIRDRVPSSVCPDRDLHRLFREVDADGGGEVDAVEFTAWLQDLDKSMAVLATQGVRVSGPPAPKRRWVGGARGAGRADERGAGRGLLIPRARRDGSSRRAPP